MRARDSGFHVKQSGAASETGIRAVLGGTAVGGRAGAVRPLPLSGDWAQAPM
ncbi:hypothetical protein JOF35_001195 [Streptomyces demainii]|uniref:Uncharacterized protein n=1 Tax=Streptomyces demainii TaxID=588122 RepID=A0ABT9KKI1_9ACTN|nr:hypothetical protein [Streptomyces demainii]